jgi:hypothetical protein
MRRYVACALTCLGIAACGSTHAARHVTVHHATPAPNAVAGGCGATSLHRGTLPAWAEPSAGCWHVTLQWAHHTDAIDLRYRA